MRRAGGLGDLESSRGRSLPGNAPRNRKVEWASPPLSPQESLGASQARGPQATRLAHFAGLGWESGAGALRSHRFR